MPSFFVPMVDADQQEAAYGDLADFAGMAIQPPDRRVFSITWTHDGVEWTATVGEQLSGTETVTKGRGRDRRYFQVPRHTTDTVLAIFEGVPFRIMHDNRSRIWNLPIYAGKPSRVVNFTA
jgi:hypothetical protein